MEDDDGENSFAGIQKAIVLLQTPSSSLNDRIIALRHLKHYILVTRELDDTTRGNINQLVLDNVLSIVLSEDRTTDLRRRQLLRTECFLMLASLLGSQTLFRGIDEKLIKLAVAQKQQHAQERRDLPSTEMKEITAPGYDDLELSVSGIDEKLSTPTLAPARPKPRVHQPPPGWVRSPSGSIASPPPFSGQAQPPNGRRPPTSPTSILSNGPGGKHSPPSSSRSMPFPSMAHASSNDDLDLSVLSASASWVSNERGNDANPALSAAGTGKGPALDLIKPLIAKAPRLLLKNKKLRPRPSMFFNSEYEYDGFVPGVDPTNWIEQDRRLGYQKPRTWFPSAAGSLDRRMVPLERNQGSEAVKPDRIVEEYLQMKALLSYVGDLVMPYSTGKGLTHTAAGSAIVEQQGNKSRPLARLTGVLEQGTYDMAIKEAIQIWTPLLGAHLPRWAKNVDDCYDPTENFNDGADDESLGSLGASSIASSTTATSLNSAYSSLRPNPKDPNPRASLQKAVLVSQDALKCLLRKEIKGAQRTDGVLRETLHMLTQSDSVTRDRVENTQDRLNESLSEEKHTVEQTLSAIQTLTKETIRLQYASLPSRYLLVVEGRKANPRVILAKVTLLFCRTRRRNLLAMALGAWKICLIEGQRKAVAVQYAKTAAVYLIREWVISRKFRQMRKWTKRWRLAVRRLIFDQRNAAVLPLQTLYRRWRDRCIIIRMHLLGPYNGPLSDVYLGPWRVNIKFKIPRSIRNSRRMFWQAAVQIQTRWRLFFVYRETRERRKKVILLQSVIRMWPKRCQFLRLRKWTIKTQAWMRRTLLQKQYQRRKIMALRIQKYARRYLGQCWRERCLFKMWKKEEVRLSAAILIQTRWREFAACRRVARIRQYLKKREWAGLILQRQWYKQKRAYHTFVLMCALRASEEIDIEFNRLIVNMRRYYSARIVQRVYAVRFFRRNLTSAIKLQCWWRGRLGYSLVDLKRKQLWASRKLHHWARGVLRRKNRRVRKIQRCWWNYKKGSLLMHLSWRARLKDEGRDAVVARRRYFAACVVQAYVHGMWCRYWFKRTKAILKIQPPLRFYLARQRWKREKREQNHSKVEKFVRALTHRLLLRRVKQILKIHSDNMIRPQAIIRGWLVRRRFKRALKAAHDYGQAVLKIQRCYRKSGAMAAAVAEVMAVRRKDSNPFRQCLTIHSLMIELRKKCNRLYNYRDPRAGLRVPAFFYRLGLPDFIPMFPRKEFATMQDMQGITMQHLNELHDDWMEQLDKAARGKGLREAGNKKKEKPLKQFQLILDTLKPPLGPRAPSQQQLIQGLMAVQNSISPTACGELAYDKFYKKFGENHLSKAHNFSEKIVNGSWIDYNNFLGLGLVTTLRLIHRCIDNCTSAGEVAPLMEEFRGMFPDVSDDLKWNKRRVADCANLLQLAYERANAILGEMPPPAVVLSEGENLPDDPVKVMLDKVGSRVLSYKRKFGFMRDRFIKEKQRQAKEEAKNPNRAIKLHHDPHWALPEDRRDHILTVDECVELPFSPNIRNVDQLDFEFNTSIAQLYQQTFDKLITATLGIQGLKDTWKRNSVRRVVTKEREQKFLIKASDDYMHMIHDNHVTRVWKEFQRKENVIRMFQARLKEAADRKALVQGLLKWVPRYGWIEQVDEEGTSFWQDDLNRGYDSQFEMPIYTHDHWKAVCVLQRRTQAFLEGIRERKRQKELEKQRQIELIEAAWLEQLKRGQKKINFTLKVTPNGITAMMQREKKIQEDLAAAATAAAAAIAAAAAAAATSAADDGASPMVGTGGLIATAGAAKSNGEDSSNGKSTSTGEKSTGEGESEEAVVANSNDDDPDRQSSAVDDAEAESRRAAEAVPTGFGQLTQNTAAASTEALNSKTSALQDSSAVSLKEAESKLPWRLRFNEDPKLVTGMWALLATHYVPEPPAGMYPYPAHSANDYGIGELLKSRAAASRQKSRRGGRVSLSRDSPSPSRDGVGVGGRVQSAIGSSSRNSLRSRDGSNKSTTPGSRGKLGSSFKPGTPGTKGEGDDWATEDDVAKGTPYKALSSGYSYEVVVVFSLRSGKEKGQNGGETRTLCNCRTVQGQRFDDVDVSRLFLMNIEKGMGVECRWKRQKAFYRGVILGVTLDHLLEPRYTVRYEDGEVESGIQRDMIRPSAASMDAWFDARNRQLKAATLTLKRQQQFAAIRAERLRRLQTSAFEAERSFAMHWTWAAGATPTKDFSVPLTVANAHNRKIAAAAAAAAAAAEAAAAARRGRTVQPSTLLVASQEEDQDSELSLLRLRSTQRGVPDVCSTGPPPPAPERLSVAWEGLRAAAAQLQVLDKGIKTNAEFNQVPFRHGWGVVRSKTDPNDISFVNRFTKETTDVLSVASHRASDEFYARKLQAAWAVRKARVAFKRLLYRDSVEEIATSAIKRARKIACINFYHEGVSLLHLIRRCGFSEVAAAIEKKFKLFPRELAALTIDSVVNLKPDRFESMGIGGAEDGRFLKNLQKWWKETTPLSRDKGLKFINWFDNEAGWRDEFDSRSLREVMQAGENAIYDRFAKLFPQNVARCRNAASRIVNESLYPITFAQLDNYLKKWGDKADLATRDNVQELQHKGVVSAWREEKDAYSVLWGATRRLIVVYGNLGLRNIRDNLKAAEVAAQTVISSAPSSKQREKTTTGGDGPGVEGRAAHILRTKVFQYLDLVNRGARLLQRIVRGFVKKNKFQVLMKKRFSGIRLMQRFVRGCMDRGLARILRAEQRSDWEQMWDPVREIVYFYNHVTTKSSYLEPAGVPYRPLIRDRRSQALMQAWPFLDEKRAPGLAAKGHTTAARGLDGKHASVAPALAFCSVCRVRRCVRLCTECLLEVRVDLVMKGKNISKKETHPTPFCFPCFTQAHGENTVIANHSFTVVSQPETGASVPSLLCVGCDDAATRKCLGILDDNQIDELCFELSRTHPRGWPQLLAEASVGGERKLQLILEDVLESRSEAGGGGGGGGGGSVSSNMTGGANSIDSEGGGGLGSPAGDKSVASGSYSHGGSSHTSLGRGKEEYHISALQLQKLRQALERTRAECDECYCEDCYKDVHSGGKRSMHRWVGFNRHAPVCVVCTRSPAAEKCVDCDSAGYCSTCFRVFHSMGRKRKHRHEPIRDELFPGQAYCQECDRRAAVNSCTNPATKDPSKGVSKFLDQMEADRGINQDNLCNTRCCESCFLCVHKPTCDSKLAKAQAAKAAEETKKLAQRVAKDPSFASAQAALALQSLLCVACGEPADQKCLQCGDPYCSKTWMGNEGCFFNYHRKGQRAGHKTVTLESLKPSAVPEGGWAQFAKLGKK